MRNRLVALLTSVAMVASLAVVTAAPAAAHHDDEFTFFDVHAALTRAMDAKTAQPRNQIKRGGALVYNIRGWRQHNGELPRWSRRCAPAARALLRDGYRYGVALKRLGIGRSVQFQWAPNPPRARILARAQRNATYRALDDTLERWEDCTARGWVPRRFR